MESRIEYRKKEFKKSSDDPRRKREDINVQIRKESRDAQMAKRRQQAMETQNMDDSSVQPAASMLEPVTGLRSNDPEVVFFAAQQCRKMLSIAKNPPIQEVIDAGVVPQFVEFLRQNDKPALQFEAAWVLTNIASGTQDQTRVVVENGTVPIFINLMSSSKEEVREQAVWALGNIAGDNAQCRDLVLREGGLPPLLEILRSRDKVKITMLRNATWTLSNLCRGKPEPVLEWVAPALPVLHSLIYEKDSDVLADACWALSYISDGPANQNANIDAVVHAGVCQRLVELLNHQDVVVQTPALRAVGNIVTGNDMQTQTIIMCNVLPMLHSLLSSPRRGICKEACWAVSNITAGNQNQIQEVFTCNIIPTLVRLLRTAEFEIKKEAAWAISNAASGGNTQQVEFLVKCECIKPLIDLLDCPDSKIVCVALEALNSILRTGELKMADMNVEENPYLDLVEAAGGASKLEALQSPETPLKVYNEAVKIMTRYFNVEQADELSFDESGNDASMSAGFGGNVQGAFRF